MRFWNRRTAKERSSAALNTRSRFDGVIHFLENVNINCLAAKNSPSSQMEDFSCDHVLIPSNSRGHSKLCPENIEQPTMFRTKRGLRSGSVGSKSGEFVVGSDSIVTLTRRDSIVAQAVSHKNQIEVRSYPLSSEKCLYKYQSMIVCVNWTCKWLVLKDNT